MHLHSAAVHKANTFHLYKLEYDVCSPVLCSNTPHGGGLLALTWLKENESFNSSYVKLDLPHHYVSILQGCTLNGFLVYNYSLKVVKSLRNENKIKDFR